MGKPFLPHQQYIADVALEIDEKTGRFAYSSAVVIGPRQVTGKTEFLLPLMTHRCIGFERFGPQRVMYTAQTADDARKKWRDVHVQRLLAVKKLRQRMTPRLAQNKEAILWDNGSMWYPGSATGKTGGTGDTLDLGIIDEAWSRPDDRTELAMRPAKMTRKNSQIWVMSMIPGLSRALPGTWPYLKNKREQGRARVSAGSNRGMAFFDFSAAEGLDPGDPATWWSCMPALGYTVEEDTVREDFDSLGLVDFCAEYLGWEPAKAPPRWTVISYETWAGREDVDSQIVSVPILGVEMDEHRERAWVGVAGRRADSDLHVEIIEPGDKIAAGRVDVDWCERRIAEICERHDSPVVVIDPGRPANSLITPLRNRGITVMTPNRGEIAAGCGRFYDATGQTRDGRDGGQDAEPYTGPLLWHVGQHELETALGQARKLDLPGGAFTFVKKGESSELGPLYAVILAMIGELAHGEVDYDVSESVGAATRCGRCGLATYPCDGSWWHARDDSPACDGSR